MKARHFTVLLIACAVLGCRTAKEEPSVWAAVDEGGISHYANFYEALDEYPDYAISVYIIDEPYDQGNDLKCIRESLRLCRATFGRAFNAKKLQHCNPDPEGYPAIIPFEPHYVVTAIQNIAEHRGASTFAASYKVAYIIPTELVFAEHYNFEKAFQAAYVYRDPVHYDAPTPEEVKDRRTAGRVRWVAIERHETLFKKRATMPNKKRNVVNLE